MKTFTLLLLLLFFNFSLLYSQITNIPDTQFEQVLIDQNIDSDGVINGQVLTSDISGLTELSLYNYIEDLTGLEDFVSLEYLNLDNFYDINNQEGNVDLSNNVNLKKFTMYGGGDAINNNVNKITLNNNPAIDTIHAPDNWLLRELDLKTGSTDASNIDIDIHIIPFDLWGESVENFDENFFCIRVTDAAAAAAGTGVYSSWTIKADDNPYYFSETCTLGTNRFDENDISIYPNPVNNNLNIKSNNTKLNSVKIFNLQGQLVNEFKALNTDVFDISELASGLYVIHIESDTGIAKKKFIKQ